jgi:hypothetical protein
MRVGLLSTSCLPPSRDTAHINQAHEIDLMLWMAK